MMRQVIFLSKVCFFSFCLLNPVWSFPYSEIYVFGDSMSDTGRLFAATGIYPPPYYEGRYTNGPMWAEYLAETLLLKPYNPRTNFAWAAATTGTINRAGNFPGLQNQIEEYLNTTPDSADPKALYIVWSGTVDLLTSGETQPEETVTTAITNIGKALDKLRNHGVQHLVVPNVFDLGKLPRGLVSEDPQALTTLSTLFNQSLSHLLQAYDDVVQINLFAFLEALKTTSNYFVNTTEACLNPDSFAVCSTPHDYLFWDDIHPSTQVHQWMAALFHSAVAPPFHLESLSYPKGESSVYIPALEIKNGSGKGLILGAKMQRDIARKTGYAFLAINHLLQINRSFEEFVLHPFQLAQQATYSTGHLHLPVVYRIESSESSMDLQFVAKFTVDLEWIPTAHPEPFQAPLFLLTGATILND